MELINTFNHLIQRLARTKLNIGNINRLKVKLSQCLLCSGRCQTIALLCQHCLADLPYFHKHFTNLLLWPKVAQHVSHQYVDQLLCLAPYQWPFNHWLNQLKYQNKFELAELLGQILVHQHHQTLSRVNKSNSIIINVPIHIQRWQERGYNQSHLVVKHIAKAVGIPYQNNLVLRHKATEKQVGKNGVARRKNLKNAFTVNPLYANSASSNVITTKLPSHVIIFDDVVTTGTTVNELAKLLKMAGVNYITVIAITLAIKKT